jgi:response regulator NasT
LNTTAKSKNLRVMLVDDNADRASTVEASLRASGIEVLSVISTTSALLFQIEQHRPDVVLIALQFPGRDILESLAVVNHHNPTPMVMFSQEDDPDYIQQAVKAGVSTYLLEGINADKVKPIIDLAMAQFSSFQQLRSQLQSAQSELESHSLVNRAKKLLMTHKSIGEDAAHRMMTRTAMDNNLKIQEVARTIISTLDSDGDSN